MFWFSSCPQNFPWFNGLETYLVGGLVELLGVEGSANAEGDTLTEEDVVGNGGDTTVVDLALFIAPSCQCCLE